MTKPPVTVVELEAFAAWADRTLSDDERQALIWHLAFSPSAGDVIPELHGLRKLRWRRPGSGKRGGYRVIYYFHDARFPLFLMTAYAKSAQTDLSAAEKRSLLKLVDDLRARAKGRRS